MMPRRGVWRDYDPEPGEPAPPRGTRRTARGIDPEPPVRYPEVVLAEWVLTLDCERGRRLRALADLARHLERRRRGVTRRTPFAWTYQREYRRG